MICREANLRRDELMDLTRIADAGDDALQRRADIIDDATVIVEEMIDEVLEVRPVDAKDASVVATWEDLYRTLIEDRRLYTEELRRGVNEPFAETMLEAPVSSYLNDFATGNRMLACKAPMALAVCPTRQTLRHSPFSNRRITLAGDPTATQYDGISPVTTLFAPITTCSPMMAPGKTTEP